MNLPMTNTVQFGFNPLEQLLWDAEFVLTVRGAEEGASSLGFAINDLKVDLCGGDEEADSI